jgi:hypothetical protein
MNILRPAGRPNREDVRKQRDKKLQYSGICIYSGNTMFYRKGNSGFEIETGF